MHDLRYACRNLLRTPGFSLIAVLTLALGIGTTTTVFSWIDRVLLNPLPGVADAGRIVALETLSPSGGSIDTSFPDFLDYQTRSKTLSSLLVFKERALNLGEGEHAERVWGELVSANFFETLGVRPRIGRFFSAGDSANRPSAAPVVVMSEALWRRNFASDPDVLGRIIQLNHHHFTVIGVAPAGFSGSLHGLAFDVWVPIGRHAQLMGPSELLESRGWRWFHTLVRLAPGATLASARAELSGLAAQLALAFPASNRGISVELMPVRQSKDGVQNLLGRPLLLLLGVCGLLLLIVCANISNLLLVRASTRQREMCIRQALGARRRQLMRQLLVENLVLALAGAAAGLLCTLWAGDLLRQFIPDATLPISIASNLNPAVFAVASLLSLGTAILAGLAAMRWTARTDPMAALRTGGRSVALSPRAERFRGTLVVAQVAVAVVTLACTALAAKSFFAAKKAYPGFDTSNVLLAAIKLDASGYATREQGVAFLDRLQQRLGTIPGVQAAAIAENVPLGLSRGSWEEINVPDYTAAPQEDLRIYRNLVSPGYFALMHIPLLAGREFNAADRDGAPWVAIVSAAFARRYFGTGQAVGRAFSIWGGQRKLTVVGVAVDIKVDRLEEPLTPYYYVPLAQFFFSDTGVAIHLRTDGVPPLSLLPAVRKVVHSLDPAVPIFEAVSLEDFTSAARFVQKTAASLLAVLGTMALALAALGLYGVLAFAVTQRTAEFGVRLALGARPVDIARLVLRRGSRLVALGVAIGMIAALAAVHLLASTFYGVNPLEPEILITVAPLVLIAGLLASWLPARRATKVDPMTALRAE